MRTVRAITYGPGGFDANKPNGNVVDERTIARPVDTQVAHLSMAEARSYVLPKTVEQGVRWDDFSNQGEWTATGRTDHTATDDTHGPTMLLTSASGAQRQWNRYINFDWTGQALTFWVKPLDANLDSLYIDFASAGASFNTSAFYLLKSTYVPTVGEWQKVVIPASALSTVADISDMRRARLTLIPNSGVTEVAIADGRLCPMVSQPGVVWTFDDGWDTTYDTAFPIIQAAGHTGVVAVETDNIGGANRMTVAELQALEAAGWEMVNHTDTGQTMAAFTSTQVATAVNDGYYWLRDNGFNATAAQHLILPGGGYSATVRAKVEELCFASYLAAGETAIAPYLADRYKVPRYGVYATTAAATLQTEFNRVAARGGVLIVELHSIVASGATGVSVNLSVFRAMVDAAVAAGLTSYGLTDLF